MLSVIVAAVRLSLLLVTLLLIGACARSGSDFLVVYSAGPRPLIEELAQEFTEQTGHPVRLFVATTGQLMAKLEAERFRQQADVILLASPVAAEHLKQQGRLLPLDVSAHPWHDPELYYAATSAAAVGVAIGSRVSEQLDWQDWLTYEGPLRLAMPSPSRSGTAGDFLVDWVARHPDIAWPLLQQARQAGLEFPAANSQAMTSLLIGTYDVVLAAVDYIVFNQQAQGSDVQLYYPASGAPLITRPVAVLANTSKPELAQQFVHYLLQEDSQQRIAGRHLMPLADNVDWSEQRQRSVLPSTHLMDAENALADQGRVLRRFQYQLERSAIVRSADAGR